MHVYFSGLGGVAIGPLALIAQDLGYEVSGSDIQRSRLTDIVKERGVDVKIGQDGSQIAAAHTQSPIDWIVVTSSLPESHPELAFAKKHNIKLTKRDELINHILKEQDLKLVAISGTHGKTTTTAMITWLFKQLNEPVSYSIGTVVPFGPYGQFQKGSHYFIYECDEYDHNFLAFHPHLGVITTIDYDHPDTYPTKESYQAAFGQFASQCGQLVVWEDDLSKLDNHHLKPVVLTYADVPDRKQLPLVGEHVRQNAYQAMRAYQMLAGAKKADESELLAILGKYPGTDRRLEVLARSPAGGAIYTTYAHHPKEIKVDLQAVREVADEVIVVYQPHQNTRQHAIAKEYRDAFDQAAHVYWLPTYITREQEDLPILSPAELIKNLADSNKAEPAEMNDALIQKIKEDLNRGAHVIFMGAGPIDDWARQNFKI
ncbi:MAG TPA: Mur ligase domain-containing protein [Candidatus Saccharimonadales bacterium]|nr:Mur ligase domain-containing protein [Candidatus Saccharimonadales bacterium]